MVPVAVGDGDVEALDEVVEVVEAGGGDGVVLGGDVVEVEVEGGDVGLAVGEGAGKCGAGDKGVDAVGLFGGAVGFPGGFVEGGGVGEGVDIVGGGKVSVGVVGEMAVGLEVVGDAVGLLHDVDVPFVGGEEGEEGTFVFAAPAEVGAKDG